MDEPTRDRRPPEEAGTRRPERASLLDLPLRGGAKEPEAGPPVRHRTPPAAPPPRRRQRGLKLWPFLLAVGAVAAGIAWLLLVPSRPRAVFSELGLGFDETRVGSAAEAREVTVHNGGERAMRIERVEIVGEAAADFRVAAETCTEAVREARETCLASVAFEPIAAGERRAELRLAGNLRGGESRLPLYGLAIAPAARLDPPALDFGSQGVDERSAAVEIRIVNAGSAPLAIRRVRLAGDHPDDFDLAGRCSGTEVAIGESCAFTASFAPRSAGPRSARLSVESDAPGEVPVMTLAGVGVWSGPSFTAESTSLDFGAQRSGRRTEPRIVELVNRAGAPRRGPAEARIRGDDGFELAANGCRDRAVEAGRTCRLEVAFTPPAEGPHEATLEVLLPDGSTLSVALAGRGIAPRLALRPERIEFGGTRAGARSAARAVELANTGEAPLAVESVRLRGAGEAFSVRGDGCSRRTVAPRKSCRVEIDFAPPSAGEHRALLEVRSDARSAAAEVEITGVGTVAGLGAAPSSLDFGDVLLGEATSRSLRVVNTGSARLEIASLRTEGDDSPDFQVVDIGCALDQGLAPGAECSLDVAFRPTDAGESRAALAVRHNGPGSPSLIPLRGRAVEPLPEISVSPPSLDFGSHEVGSRSDIRTVTVRNPGRGDLRLIDFVVAGAHAADFRLVPGTCQGAPRIISGSECSVGLRFSPEAAGPRAAELRVRHNAPGREARVGLTGRGVEPPPGPGG